MATTPVKRPILKDFLAHVTTVTKVALLGLAIYVVWLCCAHREIDYTLVTYHAIFCAMGWIFFMNVSVLCMSEYNVFTKYIDQAKKTKVHMGFQIIGFGFVFGGFMVEVLDYTFEHRTHFASAHGVIGLLAIVFGIMSYINSLLVYYPSKFENVIKPHISKIFHICIGIISIILGAAATITGFYTSWFKFQVDQNYTTIEWCLAITVLTLVWILVSPLLSTSKQIKSMIG